MPARKKQKTGNDSSASTREDSPESSSRHKSNNNKKRDNASIPPFEYVCIPRPYFDFKAQNRTGDEQESSDTESEDDEDDNTYAEAMKFWEKERASGEIFQPAKAHKERKWVMMREGWKMFCDYKRRAKYTDPHNFGMYISDGWHGCGLHELIEDLMIIFDTNLRSKGEDENSMLRMWATLSALAFWLHETNGDDLIDLGDFGRASDLTGIMGCALLTALAAIEDSGELNRDSKFLDLPLVISSILLWSADLEDYNIEGDPIFWRPYAGEYFTRAGLDPAKGINGTAELLERLKLDPEDELDIMGISEKDIWGWTRRFEGYEKCSDGVMGGGHYDITKMTRKERASYAFDKKDPLAGISDRDLKEGNIDIP